MSAEDLKDVADLVCVLCYSEDVVHFASFEGRTPGQMSRAHEVIGEIFSTIAYCCQCWALTHANPLAALYWQGVAQERVRVVKALGLPSRTCMLNPRPVDDVTRGGRN